MKRKIKHNLIMLALLLDDVAAVALVFLILWIFKIDVPLWLAIVAGVAFGVFVFVVHRAVSPVLFKRKVTGSESLIGSECEVIEPLTPAGTIKIDSEYWTARSVEGDIQAGETVQIVEINRLTVKVRKPERG